MAKYEVLTDDQLLQAVENRILQREQEHYAAEMYLEEFSVDPHTPEAQLTAYKNQAESATAALSTLYKRRDALKANIAKAKKASSNNESAPASS